MKFLWGVATSAHQIEGYNQHSDWWAWEQAGNIEGGARSGPATDHWNRRDEDLDLIQGLHANAYRFSVEWAKVEPQEGQWNESAWQWYDALLVGCQRRGLEPMVTLLHFTLPQWLAERGGLTAKEFPKFFERFTEKAAARWGKQVQFWCTLNEPMVQVVGSYLGKFMPPAEFSPPSVSLSCRQLLEAHVRAYDAIHAARADAQVGIAHSMLAFLPDRAWHPLEVLLAQQFEQFYSRSWIQALLGKKQKFSIPFFVSSPPPYKAALGRCTMDFLGLNYYTKAYVQWRPRDKTQETMQDFPLGVAFARRTEAQSDLGWAVYPEGLRGILASLKNLPVPIYITENGIADKTDALRPDYLQTHLQVVAEAIADGVDIRGFFYWSLLDNFEWVKGFGPRFGLFGVDYRSFQRQERPSAALYRSICQAAQGKAPRPH